MDQIYYDTHNDTYVKDFKYTGGFEVRMYLPLKYTIDYYDPINKDYIHNLFEERIKLN